MSFSCSMWVSFGNPALQNIWIYSLSFLPVAMRLCKLLPSDVFSGGTLSSFKSALNLCLQSALFDFPFISVSFCRSIACLVSCFWGVLVKGDVPFYSSMCQIILIIILRTFESISYNIWRVLLVFIWIHQGASFIAWFTIMFSDWVCIARWVVYYCSVFIFDLIRNIFRFINVFESAPYFSDAIEK